jgi:aspartate/methionine/tyrosine aminotransferase
VQEVAFKAMQDGLTHYGPSRGLPELRGAIASRVSREHGVDYDPQSEVLVTHGGVHAYYAAMQAALNPGDEVLIPDPDWATHANMVQMLRGVPVRVAAAAEDGFIPPISAWERALTSKTRILVISYPSNPTGAYPGRSYLQSLQDLPGPRPVGGQRLESRELYYGEKPTARPPRRAQDRTLLVSNLSKTLP